MEGAAPAASAAPVAFEALLEKLAAMGDRVSEFNARVREVDAQLEENLLLLPNQPHISSAVP